MKNMRNVIVEPLPGHSIDKVANALCKAGALSVNVLAVGHLSVRAPSEALDQIKGMAEITDKRMETWQNLELGQIIKTVEKLEDRDFTKEGIAARRPNSIGAIIGHSDSHGLCYYVRHQDGTKAYYDPDEIRTYMA